MPFHRLTCAGLIGLAVLFLSIGSSGHAQEEQVATHVMQQFDAIMAKFRSEHAPGVAVMVRKNGHTLIASGYGATNLERPLPIQAETDFRLASCTKQFTATAIMLLVDDGKLRYSDRLTDIFPEFPAYGRKITIRHLLNHTSGLPDYEELMDRAEAGGAKPWTRTRQIQAAEVLALLEKQTRGRFAPGTSWSYSNSGYVVLGLVVEKVSGKPFQDFLRERIFGPLKMEGTVAFVQGKNHVSHRAFGYSKTDDSFDDTDQSSTSATLGDGGIYSNLQDLAKWDEALTDHTLLDIEEMKPALDPFRLPDGNFPNWSSGPGDTDPLGGKAVEYGFGWFLDPYRGHRRMWHYGDTSGFKTAIERFPDDRVTVVVLANRTDVDAAGLAEQIADLFLPQPK